MNKRAGEMSCDFASNLPDALPNTSFIGLALRCCRSVGLHPTFRIVSVGRSPLPPVADMHIEKADAESRLSQTLPIFRPLALRTRGLDSSIPASRLASGEPSVSSISHSPLSSPLTAELCLMAPVIRWRRM